MEAVRREGDMERRIRALLENEFGVLDVTRIAGVINTEKIAIDAIENPQIAPGAVHTAELAYQAVDVTVLAGQSTGTATVVSGSSPLSVIPTSNQDQFVDSVLVSGTTLTVTLAANATADNVFKVHLLTA